MTPFFIYCLPRSGSCWLSVFLTAFDSYCYHEPLADMTVQQLKARLVQRPDYTAGAIDTGAYRTGKVAGLRGFVLKRSLKEVQESANRNGVRYDAAEEAGVLANVTAGMPEIDYHQLSDVWYLERIWSDLVGTPFDRERAGFFTELRIERDLGKFFAARPHLGRQYAEVTCRH